MIGIEKVPVSRGRTVLKVEIPTTNSEIDSCPEYILSTCHCVTRSFRRNNEVFPRKIGSCVRVLFLTSDRAFDRYFYLITPMQSRYETHRQTARRRKKYSTHIKANFASVRSPREYKLIPGNSGPPGYRRSTMAARFTSVTV